MTGHTLRASSTAKRELALNIALVVTFVPFLWKATTYALLGSYVPLLVFLFLGTLVALGRVVGARWARRAVRIWCAAMIGWGMARLMVMFLFVIADLNEAHLRSQVSVSFAAVSVVYIVAGVGIWRRL